MIAAAASSERIALALLPLSMKIAPDIIMNGPSGVNCKDLLDMMAVCLGISLHFGQKGMATR